MLKQYLKSIHHIIYDLLISCYRIVTGKRKFICEMPFNSISFTPEGYTHCCYTSNITPYYDANTPKEFMNSDESKKLRKCFLKGDYSKCPEDCHIIIKGDNLKSKFWQRPIIGLGTQYGKYWYKKQELHSKRITSVSMVHDDSCNLYCKMCRSQAHGGSLPQPVIDDLWNKLNDIKKQIKILGLGGSGEPLIQSKSIELLTESSASDFPKLDTVSIVSNGLEFTERFWTMIPSHLKDKISLIISLDAASEETYKKIRLGGDFKRVMKNIKFASTLNLKYFGISMVVQNDNFEEMLDFIDMAKRNNAHPIFGEIKHCPGLECHHSTSKNYDRFIEIIQDKRFDSSDVVSNFILDIKKKLQQ